MDVLIVDTAARGHVEAQLAYDSALVDKVYLWPDKVLAADISESTGLPSLQELGDWDIAKNALVNWAKEKGIGYAFVTADDPIAAGLGDDLTEAGVPNFSPTKEASKLESSKVWMKETAAKLGVPTAEFKVFEVANNSEVTLDTIQSYILEKDEFPVVLKADGLAAGKGVTICNSPDELPSKLEKFRNDGYLDVGKKVIVEDYLEGPEISLHAWCDGERYVMFPFAMQDHKTIYDNDKGPMTGGMGVITPVPGITADDIEKLGRLFIEPFMKALKTEGHDFKGVMYPSIKLTKDGPKLLEVNVRPGDPEAPAVLPDLNSDFVEIGIACAEGRLAEIEKPKWRKGAAVCISLAAKGYPDSKKTEKGAVISGIDKAIMRKGVKLYDYGIKQNEETGNLEVNSGRVIAINARGKNLKKALKRGYKAAADIHFDGEEPQFRKDLGKQANSKKFKKRVRIMQEYLAAA